MRDGAAGNGSCAAQSEQASFPFSGLMHQGFYNWASRKRGVLGGWGFIYTTSCTCAVTRIPSSPEILLPQAAFEPLSLRKHFQRPQSLEWVFFNNLRPREHTNFVHYSKDLGNRPSPVHWCVNPTLVNIQLLS